MEGCGAAIAMGDFHGIPCLDFLIIGRDFDSGERLSLSFKKEKLMEKALEEITEIPDAKNALDKKKIDNNSVIIITHSTKLLKNLNVDYVHVLVDGRIVLSGDASLADRIDREGYKNIIEGLKNEN